jgi:hypothetical protein
MRPKLPTPYRAFRLMPLALMRKSMPISFSFG